MPGPDWDDAALSLLRQKTAEGMLPSKMFELGLFPGRSLNAIRKARHNYRLVAKTEFSQRVREGIRNSLHGKRRERYIAFLRSDEGRSMTAAAIAKKFKLKRRTVSTHRELYDAAPFSKEVQDSTRELQTVAAKRRHAERKEVEEVERRKLLVRLQREESLLPRRRCIDCKEQLYATADFFPLTRSSRNPAPNAPTRATPRLSRRCYSCTSDYNAAKWQRYSKSRKRRRRQKQNAPKAESSSKA